MLVKPSLEELLPKVENRYILAMLTAKRARQLTGGAQKFVDTENPSNVTIAAEEIADDKLALLEGEHKVTVPLRPEIEEARRLAALEAEAKRREEFMEENRQRSAQNLGKELSEAVGGEGATDGAEMMDFTQQFINLLDKQQAEPAAERPKAQPGIVKESVKKVEKKENDA